MTDIEFEKVIILFLPFSGWLKYVHEYYQHRIRYVNTVAATTAPRTQKPALSKMVCLNAPLLGAEVLVSVTVPFGNVPLMTTVLVPFTSPTRTSVEF